jgi:hypothetical protein
MTKDDLKGHCVTDVEEMTAKCFLEGNQAMLVEYFQHVLWKDDVRCAVFASDFFNDVCANNDFNTSIGEHAPNAEWDTIVVIHEFGQVDRTFREEVGDSIVPHNKMWGPNFFLNE